MTSLVLHDVLGGYGRMRIVNGVTLEVREGEVVAVLGANGSGKSTLLKTIMNLASLQGGSIEWKGEDISGLPTWQRVRRGLGYLPQGHVVFPSLTTGENLALAAKRASFRPSRPDLSRVHDLFPLLARLGPVMAGKLSGGERRMLAFACTLLQKPEMLILDEPTGDLAPLAIERMFEAIARVREEEGWPILLVEQNVGRAMTIADRVCVLRRGAILLDRPAASVTEGELASAFMEHAQGVPEEIAGWMTGEE
jgi:ABC-type branched-subunit amino acid transport system ATPase component